MSLLVQNTVASQVSKYMANAVSIANIWGNIVINIKDSPYLAKGDGITDDTAAILAAIEAAPPGSEVIFPYTSSGYLVSDSITITKPIQISGKAGMYSKILASSSMGNTKDVFIFSISTLYRKELSGMRWIYITPQSGTPARHAVHFDLTNPGQYISNFTLEHCYFDQLGGWGIRLTNPTNTDGFFASVIRNNLINGGTFWERLGDSVRFYENTVTGANVGFQMSYVSGAAQVVIRDNNITTAGGAIRIDSGDQVKIIRNQIEQVATYTGSVDAAVYIGGNAPMCVIEDNNITAHNKVPYCIRINSAYRVSINKNVMRKGTDVIIVVDAGGNKTQIGYNNMYISAFELGAEVELAPSITDNGIGTMGYPRALFLVNSYTAVTETGTYHTPSVIKDCDGFVHPRGRIAPGTRTANTLITTLSAGYRPDKIMKLAVPYLNYTSTKWEICIMILDTNGELRIESALDTSEFDLSGIAPFRANY